MKIPKLLTTLALAIGVLFMASCEEETVYHEPDTQLKLSTTSCAFKARGGEKTIHVTTSGESWDVDLSETDDFHVEMDDKFFVIWCDANPGEEVREATATVKAGNASATINLIQDFVDKTEDYLIITPGIETHSVNYMGGTLKFNVEANCEWRASADKGWCSVVSDATDNTITVEVEGNNTDQRQSATITVVYGNENKEETVGITVNTKAYYPYSMLLGKWKIYSDAWQIYDTPYPAGTMLECTIKENVVGESYYIKDIYFKYSSQIAFYNEITNTISMPLGWPIYSGGAPANSANRRTYYLVAYDLATYGYADFQVSMPAIEGKV